jgi:glutathione S-transferase
MITLYHAPKTRSSRFLWLLEEIGQPYEVKLVDIRRGDANQGSGAKEAAAEYRRIHPHGKVPAIVHDGVPVFESAAIALYLGDAFPAAGLAPAIGDPKRGPYVTWLAYYAGVMEPAFVGKALGFTTTNSTTGWASTDDVLSHVTETLARAPYLVGEQLTTADILFGSTFALFQGSPLLPPSDVLSAYVERIKKRPAYVRAAAKDAGG